METLSKTTENRHRLDQVTVQVKASTRDQARANSRAMGLSQVAYFEMLVQQHTDKLNR